MKKPLHQGAQDSFCSAANEHPLRILAIVVPVLLAIIIWIATNNSHNAPEQIAVTIVVFVLLIIFGIPICNAVVARTPRWQRKHHHDHGIH